MIAQIYVHTYDPMITWHMEEVSHRALGNKCTICLMELENFVWKKLNFYFT